MLELNKNNFNAEIKEGVVVIDAWASWCGPCRAMAPIFEELSKEMKNVKFSKLDVDSNSEIASRYNIMSIPTFLIFKNGKEVSRIVGGNPKSLIKSKIESILK